MLFFFDFDNYLKLVRFAWNEKTPKARRHALAALCVSVPIVSTLHAICFFLDGILFPGLRKVEVREPVFVVGHARSGTTLTHRLLGRDSGRFSSFLLYECYFPSLLQKKLIRLGIRLDRRVLRGFLARRVAAWEERRYGRYRHAHAMGLTIPEEDDITLYYSMASGFWTTRMPCLGGLDFYHMNDWSPRKRRRYNAFYRDCVRRQLYLNGGDKTHLSKNPLWAGRVASLIEFFPDARFVVNVRDPRETIPSLLKLVRGAWKRLGWDEDRQQRTLGVLVDQAWHSYRHPLETLVANPGTPSAVVEYRDLCSDPAGTLERVYRDLGLPLSEEFRQLLATESRRERDHETRHRYSLAEFGLEEERIREQLGDLFERFQWDAGAAQAPGTQGEA